MGGTNTRWTSPPKVPAFSPMVPTVPASGPERARTFLDPDVRTAVTPREGDGGWCGAPAGCNDPAR
ncbi:hypothetical protein Arub01_18810 [Actinomadura rubrobrunea]|uniref:Uncharacterized protein n=1 Tax=Actinomadura rubrobrunea TaxID=115335 RepID=A0A9W6PU55_9ACTN|nr:hypothetical protein Arub01_18810 [Actinomadura rubrobrunea]